MTQQELEQKVLILEGRLNAFERTGRFTFAKLLQFLDGRNIQTGKTTGTMIGTASDQKVGFYGHAPVAQQSGIGSPGGGTVVDLQARTAITSLINALHNIGIIS